MIVKVKNYKFKIRNCENRDYRFVYNLLKRNMYALFVKHWGRWNPNVFRDNFNKKNIRIIEYKTKRVAFYDFEFKDGFSYIHNVQVSPSRQGKGLGTCLVSLMENETKRHKLKKIRLKVFKNNLAPTSRVVHIKNPSPHSGFSSLIRSLREAPVLTSSSFDCTRTGVPSSWNFIKALGRRRSPMISILGLNTYRIILSS